MAYSNEVKKLALQLPILEAAHLRLITEISQAYVNRRFGSKGHQKESAEHSIAAVTQLLAFTKKPPWHWNTIDWDDWCVSLREAGLAFETIRNYQLGVVGFLRFAAHNDWNSRVYAETRCRIEEFVTQDMLLRHVDERLDGRRRPNVEREHIILLLDHIQKQVFLERDRGNYMHAAFCHRDYTIVRVLYALGLRIGECVGIELDSFRANPDLSRLGKYGICRVLGKGHHGSGPIPRDVPCLDPELPTVLRDYQFRIRPLLHPGEKEQAFFLSSHGTRISTADFRLRLAGFLDAVGLGDKGYSPHCLRHASITDKIADGMSVILVKELHGHKYLSTTERYAHFGMTYLQAEISRLVEGRFARIDSAELPEE